MYTKIKLILISLLSVILISSASFARDLVITFDDMNPGPKAAFENAITKFQKENPDINVIANNGDREEHKAAIRNFLIADAPDVTSWYPGNRMRPFVKAGLFEDVSDVWDENNFHEDLAAIKPTMTIGGRQWGVPYSYYQWGVYYRKDIFDKLGLFEPNTWVQFKYICETLKKNGIAPITIGTRYLWTAAGVFDYINLRTNGYKVHNDLTAGKIKYTDPRIRKTFEYWAELVNAGYFIENHASMAWQDAVVPFANGEAAMYVMGNFSVDAYKNAGLTYDQIDFFKFPEITKDMPRAEEAPADAFFIPTNAKNKRDAKKWLAFVARPDVQSEWNETIGQLPINSKAKVADDKFITEGFETLNTAVGLAQFYDRDAIPEMAAAGMEGFQEFMMKPDRLDKILKRLDKIQSKVYK